MDFACSAILSIMLSVSIGGKFSALVSVFLIRTPPDSTIKSIPFSWIILAQLFFLSSSTFSELEPVLIIMFFSSASPFNTPASFPPSQLTSTSFLETKPSFFSLTSALRSFSPFFPTSLNVRMRFRYFF
jgi:hypothetical protein